MAWTVGANAVMLPELTFEAQIELCRELGLTHYTFRPRVVPESKRNEAYSNWGRHAFDLTPQRLLAEGAALAGQLQQAGITPFGTVPNATVTDDDDSLRLHFDGAAAARAGRVRVQPPGYPQGPFDYPALLARTIKAYEHVVPLARAAGVKMVIETHAGSLATSPGLAYAIVQHFDPADVGVIFDLPNFAREGGVNPHLAVAVLGRWIDHLHFGGCRWIADVPRDEHGFRKPQSVMCELADSELYVPTWLGALRAAGIDVPLIVEDYTPDVSGAQRLRTTVEQLRRFDT